MRRIAKSIVLLLVFVTISGCSNKIPTMTIEQENQIVEYAVGKTLYYESNHDERLVDDIIVSSNSARKHAEINARKQEEEKKREEQKAALSENLVQENSEDSGEQTQASEEDMKYNTLEDMANFLGLVGCKVEYNQYEQLDAYPNQQMQEDLAFVMTATPGNTFLALKFKIFNETGDTIPLNLADSTLSYRIVINKDQKYRSLKTLLSDDFTNYVGDIQANEVLDVVILAEIPNNQIQEGDVVELLIRKDGNSIIIPLE